MEIPLRPPQRLLALALFSVFSIGNTYAQDAATLPSSKVVLRSDVKWTPLNPARGDKGPKAATLWGDRSGKVATGFLVEFLDGFSSPPHIHNTTYRGVVISGLVHNDDPDAAKMWMPATSFWTQPKGEVHITAAQGERNVAYIEIDFGPYLVLPTDEAFDEGEKPVNVHASNLVWVNPPPSCGPNRGVKIAYLWGQPEEDELNGTLLKLPAGFRAELRGVGSSLKGVVIQGKPEYVLPETSEVVTLEPGSYFGSEGTVMHALSCEEECIIYLRCEGNYDIRRAQ